MGCGTYCLWTNCVICACTISCAMHAWYMHMLSCYMYMHATYTMYMYIPLNAFLCSAYKNICCIFCTCSGVKEPVNTVYHCWSCWERAGREGGRERQRKRERATLSFPIIDQTIELFNCTSNNTGTMHTHVHMCTTQAQNYHQASQYKVHIPVSCTSTCTCYFKA